MILPPGFKLDRYKLVQVLGSPGAFGVTYYALDTVSGREVAIKELFPTDCVIRDPDGGCAIVPRSSEDAAHFQSAKRMFEQEAGILLNLRHANIVQALDYFEHDGIGTAYLVMHFEHGYNLDSHLKMQRPGRLNESELLKLLDPLLDGLEALHAMSYLHRDIKPSNIYITRGNKPLLLDFGAARQVVVGRTRPLTQVLTPGFAPFEQYSSTLKQGAYTDLYALGAVICYALTESIPDPATDRRTQDDYEPLARRLRGNEYSTAFLESVDWALQFRAEDRPQNVAAWRQALRGGLSRTKRVTFFERLRSRWGKDEETAELRTGPWGGASPPPGPSGEKGLWWKPEDKSKRSRGAPRWRWWLLRVLIFLVSIGAGAAIWWWMSQG